MTALIAMPCLGGCGTTVKRKPSRRGNELPLCKADFNRACERMERIPLLAEPNAESRRFYRFFGSRAAVMAMLAVTV